MYTDSYQNDEDHEWTGWLENINKEEICELIYVCAENSCRLAEDLKALHSTLMSLCIGEQNLIQLEWDQGSTINELSGQILSEIDDKTISLDFADKATEGAIAELKERGLDPSIEMTQHLRKKGCDL